MSEIKIDELAVAQKLWATLTAGEDGHPGWEEADQSERDEAVAVVQLMWQLCKDDLLAQVLDEFAQEVSKAVAAAGGVEVVELPESTEAFLDDPSAGVRRERQLDPWMER